jgi:hypothetical protein
LDIDWVKNLERAVKARNDIETRAKLLSDPAARQVANEQAFRSLFDQMREKVAYINTFAGDIFTIIGTPEQGRVELYSREPLKTGQTGIALSLTSAEGTGQIQSYPLANFMHGDDGQTHIFLIDLRDGDPVFYEKGTSEGRSASQVVQIALDKFVTAATMK